MASMLAQMLSDNQRRALDDLGAIEEEIQVPGDSGGRFTVTAARGGDDVWVEVRRRKETPAAAVPEPEEVPAEAAAVPVPTDSAPGLSDAPLAVAPSATDIAPPVEVAHTEPVPAPQEELPARSGVRY